jgi:CDP-diacylglycerol--serine O-phosphatidyltransferase
MAFEGHLEVASWMMVVAAGFDFLDGFSARLLHSKSYIGKDLDSLADVVSFGVAPAMILFVWMGKDYSGILALLPFLVFIIPALSAIRLAKFNHDDRQLTEFRGLPTPANALFLGFLHFLKPQFPFIDNGYLIIALAIVFSVFLVTDVKMFSLKFSNFKWTDNKIRFIFLLLSAVLLIIFKFGALPLIILLFICLSLINNLTNKK